ncbi:MAG TPA: chalcone isomerase family protein [Candidatus Binatia bacterium]|nr:chalcone isomerase family protein [Candidatus Binatia bacterium]
MAIRNSAVAVRVLEPRGRGLLLVLAALALLYAPPARARVVAGVEMPDTFRVGEQLLRLNGTALYSKFGIRILAAGLWLEQPENDASKILSADLPRRYVTHFFRRVSAKRVRTEWFKSLEQNTPDAGPEVKAQFQTLAGWIHDFVPGDEITLVYLPGHGSDVEIGGVLLGTIPGKAFADAYFACALGPKPRLGRPFRKHLLGL